MLNAILKWLGPWLLEKLVPVLNPEAARRAQALLDRSKALDFQEQEQERREQAFQLRQRDFDKRQADWQARIDELTVANQKVEDDLTKRKADIDARPDADLIDKPLPGTGS